MVPPPIYNLMMFGLLEEDGYEELTLYREGGLCPIHLGDIFDDGTYTIVYKLGEGSSSTVWLARDNRHDPLSVDHPYRYVALKVLTADKSVDSQEVSTEVSILQHLRRVSLGTSDTNLESDDVSRVPDSIVHLIRNFSHKSINGLHTVLVLPVMRRIKELCQVYGEVPTYLNDVARQLFAAVAFLHKNAIVHGDLHIENTGYLCADMNDYEAVRLGNPEVTPVILWRYSSEPSSASSAFRIPEKHKNRFEFRGPLHPDKEKRLPKYLVSSRNWVKGDDFVRFRVKPRICVADFGHSFNTDISRSQWPLVATPQCYLAPEYLFATHQLSDGSEMSPGIVREVRRHGDAYCALGDVCQQADVWSMGCLLYELLTGMQLVSDWANMTPAHEKRLVKIDPAIPDEWTRLPAVALASESTREELEEASSEFWAQTLSRIHSVAEAQAKRFYKWRAQLPDFKDPPPRPMEREEFEKLTHILRDVLRMDPRKRPPAADICKRLID